MFIINLQDVQISNVPDVNNPNEQVSILTYLNRQYVITQVFPDSQLRSAQILWRHLDEQGRVCLIVKSAKNYSVWVEKIQQLNINELLDPRLESVFRAQLCLIDGLWAEVLELLGQNQARSFGTDILVSIPSIQSIKDLVAAIALAMKPSESLTVYRMSSEQLASLWREIPRLGAKYLGKNYTQELLSDLDRELPLNIKQELNVWIATQPKP